MIPTLKRLIRRATHKRPAFPVAARHIEPSLLLSSDDDPAVADDFLMTLAVRCIEDARGVSMRDVSGRMAAPPYYPDVWPGEHYKLLAGLVRRLQPKLVVEIGTYTGMSALAMLPHLPVDGGLVTFDITPWNEIPGTLLTTDDFADGRLRQEIADLGESSSFDAHRRLIEAADLIFLDGPKDGVFENRFLAHLAGRPLPRAPVVVFDDIRVWNMLNTWRLIRKPKLDMTSFGHWSGTGFVHWIGE